MKVPMMRRKVFTHWASTLGDKLRPYVDRRSFDWHTR